MGAHVRLASKAGWSTDSCHGFQHYIRVSSLCMLTLHLHAGDEDCELRRGRPLHLSLACYARLAALWAHGALQFDTHVLHSSRLTEQAVGL